MNASTGMPATCVTDIQIGDTRRRQEGRLTQQKLICLNALRDKPGYICRSDIKPAAPLGFIQEQILTYRLLIADIERRYPEVANIKDFLRGPNADELQRLLTYRLSEGSGKLHRGKPGEQPIILTDEQRKTIFEEGTRAAMLKQIRDTCPYLQDATPERIYLWFGGFDLVRK